MIDLTEKIKQFPPLPETTTIALKKLSEEDSAVSEVAILLSNDPALTLSILKLANSPFFGFSKKISSIQNACVLLGKFSIRNVLLSQVVLNTIKSVDIKSIDIQSLWKQSLLTGCIAKGLCKKLPIQSDIGLTSGMLLKTGKILLSWAYSEKYKDVIKIAFEEKLTDFEAEKKVFGTNHSKVISPLFKSWYLPNEIIEAIENYPNQIKNPNNTLATILYISNALAIGLQAEKATEATIPRLTKNLFSSININLQQLPSLLKSSLEETDNLLMV